MSDETLYDFFDKRERTLRSRLEAAKAAIDVLEAELAAITRAREAAGVGRVELSARTIGMASGRAELSVTPSTEGMRETPLVLATEHINKSIKELALKAFEDNRHFREQGASANDLREFIRDVYGRDIDRASLSPQLSRLFQEGSLVSGNGRWNLIERPKVTTEPPEEDKPE